MRKLALGALVLGTLTFALAQKTQTVYINGQPVQAIPVTVNGKAYLQLPVDDLKKSGALTQGGNTNVSAIQGCKGQTLFNGVLRVTLLEATMKPNEYNDMKLIVRFKISNGTNKTILPIGDAAFNSDYLWAADDNGRAEQLGTWIDKETPNQDMLPGSTLVVAFSGKPPPFKPTRIIYRPEKDDMDMTLPWAKLTSMNILLECKK